MQSIRAKGSAGEPLPTVFHAFEDIGIRLLRGQFALIAAGPGTGKSLLVLTLALRMRQPVLYFSADSDAFTQLVRAICIETGCTVAQAEEAVRSEDLGAVSHRLRGIPIQFNYDASPSLDTIESLAAAWEEVNGEWPGLLVFDNITNVRFEEGAEEGLESLMEYFHTLARNTGACVVGLHHVTGPFNDADKPIPLSGVKGQVGRIPEVILTMFRPTGESVGVSKVKDRSGKADPSGNLFAELSFEGERMRLSDPSFGNVRYLPGAKPFQEAQNA